MFVYTLHDIMFAIASIFFVIITLILWLPGALERATCAVGKGDKS